MSKFLQENYFTIYYTYQLLRLQSMNRKIIKITENKIPAIPLKRQDLIEKMDCLFESGEISSSILMNYLKKHMEDIKSSEIEKQIMNICNH